MDETELQAQISAATAYEDFFVPAVFGQWAEQVVDAAEIQAGNRVLDVACGTGVLARRAATCVLPNGFVAGLDLNLGMIEVAKRLAPDIEWRQGAAEELPYPNESFDAVISQFGLMFFTDRIESLREMVRILVPGGKLAIAIFNSLDKQPAYALEVDLLERTAGKDAADALRAPFVLGDRGELEMLFKKATANTIEIATHDGVAHFPSVRSMVEADLRGWLPVMGVILTEEQITDILEEAEHVFQNFVDHRGRVKFNLSAHIVAARKLNRS